MFYSKTFVISGFPGVGKSFVSRKLTSYTTLDLDSSSFSWLREGERNPDFPNNYMSAILESLGKYDFVFVSSHDTVREALARVGIPYINVYPERSLKQNFLDRYMHRGSSIEFCEMMDANFDNFISKMEEDTAAIHMSLRRAGDTLEDVCSQLSMFQGDRKEYTQDQYIDSKQLEKYKHGKRVF